MQMSGSMSSKCVKLKLIVCLLQPHLKLPLLQRRSSCYFKIILITLKSKRKPMLNATDNSREFNIRCVLTFLMSQCLKRDVSNISRLHKFVFPSLHLSHFVMFLFPKALQAY
ncbi:CLUMA_CG012365, isoform A [Clunio marinus]|uniref:CLUMA_CG012365, isoform A n=1 Tax=Clunio marinus TaxID=568069 RepID=A0A1J1IH64_9DIPT|nr:CLUMA_CG012365, isoform A [Clunio marinus]